MPERYHRRILHYLADRRYEPRTPQQLAAELAVDQEDRALFEQAVEQLLEEDQIVLGDADKVVLPPPGKYMEGTFRGHERGFGFIIPDGLGAHGDLFIPPGNTGDALTGDKVRARVRKEDRRGKGGRSYVGRVVEVLERASKQYVGTLEKRGKKYLVETDGRALHDPVVIRDPGAKNAKPGDKVAIELVEFGGGDELPEGVIVEVLGEAGEPDVETLGVMRAFGLEEQFSQAVNDQARAANRKYDGDAIPRDRDDLTGNDPLICTIDPPDARDYDDAISIRRLEGQGKAAYELGVHIADVANFVEVGTALDEEAYQRGNSTYLPRRVIPMLPEILSNGVCSLQEGVNRYAKSCFIRYDAKGRVLSSRFSKSVIRSVKRLTYLEAQALIDDDIREARKHVGVGGEAKYPKPLIKTLKLMDELAKIIRKRRMDQGMIVLGLPEVDLIFDDSGRVVDAQPEDDAFTHTIIEMFMVEANEAAARLFDELRTPMIRRVHPDPDPYGLGDLSNFARVAGYNIPARPSRKQLQQLLERVRGKPAQRAVHFAVLRTLTKAEYAPDLIGHFALASEHYTHFTSPIRRYPDLIVHRALDAVIEAADRKGIEGIAGGKKAKQIARAIQNDKRVPDEDRLREVGRHCSATEKNSETAERELRTYLVMELLSEHLGEDFDGTVTGVTNNGISVQLDRFLVEGLIALGELPGPREERWRINTNTGALVAQRSGKTISIGDTFTVRVAKVDLARRQMDLVIVEEQRKGDKPKKRRQPKGARKAGQITQRVKKKRGRKDKPTPKRRRKRG